MVCTWHPSSNYFQRCWDWILLRPGTQQLAASAQTLTWPSSLLWSFSRLSSETFWGRPSWGHIKLAKITKWEVKIGKHGEPDTYDAINTYCPSRLLCSYRIMERFGSEGTLEIVLSNYVCYHLTVYVVASFCRQSPISLLLWPLITALRHEHTAICFPLGTAANTNVFWGRYVGFKNNVFF